MHSKFPLIYSKQINSYFRKSRFTAHNFYRPRSVASEGYVFTGVCHSFCSTRGGGGGRWSTPKDQVTTPPPPPRTWTWDLVTTPPPPHLGHGHNTHPPPPHLGHGHNTHPPPPGTWSQHLPPSPPPTWDMVTTPTPPLDYAQAGGTHPTGMHSSFLWICLNFAILSDLIYHNSKVQNEKLL